MLVTAVGCGPRYGYIHSRPPRKPRKREGRIDILVALPVSLPQSVAVMDVIGGVHRDVYWHANATRGNGKGLQLIAAWHQLRSGMDSVEGQLVDWLDRVDAVLTTGSSAALEAVAAGVPVIVVGSPNELTFNPLEWFKDESFVRALIPLT